MWSQARQPLLHYLALTIQLLLQPSARCLPHAVGFAFALMGAALLGFNFASMMILALALTARLFLKSRIDGLFRTYAGPYWLMPVRDLLSFAVFLASLFGETVHWRGSHFAVEPSGAMSQV